jgi:hypothetical protein
MARTFVRLERKWGGRGAWNRIVPLLAEQFHVFPPNTNLRDVSQIELRFQPDLSPEAARREVALVLDQIEPGWSDHIALLTPGV